MVVRLRSPRSPRVQSINLRKTPDAAAIKISALPFDHTESEHRGSNAFALSGARTATGAGMLANDMHLSLGLPNAWFRAALVWSDGGMERRVVGLTFPGVPFVIAGSNGRVAWGFTNSPTDASDLIVVQTGISPKSIVRRTWTRCRRSRCGKKSSKSRARLRLQWSIGGPSGDQLSEPMRRADPWRSVGRPMIPKPKTLGYGSWKRLKMWPQPLRSHTVQASLRSTSTW